MYFHFLLLTIEKTPVKWNILIFIHRGEYIYVMSMLATTGTWAIRVHFDNRTMCIRFKKKSSFATGWKMNKTPQWDNSPYFPPLPHFLNPPYHIWTQDFKESEFLHSGHSFVWESKDNEYNGKKMGNIPSLFFSISYRQLQGQALICLSEIKHTHTHTHTPFHHVSVPMTRARLTFFIAMITIMVSFYLLEWWTVWSEVR